MHISFFEQKILESKLKAKDPEAFSRFYDLYAERIYRFIFFKVSSQAEAQDITSEVFLKTWQYLNEKETDEIKNLSALVYKIARNSVIDWYRKQNKQPVALDEQIEDTTAVNSAEQISLDWDIRTVKENLLKLKDEYREVLVMRYLDEMEISEIAKVLEKSKGNIRVLIHRALKNLKESLEKEK